MSWVRAVALRDLPVGRTLTFTLREEELLICRLSETEVCAVENVCSHDDEPLGEAKLTGAIIECPRHGARFDVTTGKVVRMPAATPLATFPARIREGWVEVGLEDQ